MAIIKSALEIALEKTQEVEADKEAFEANNYITEGKRAVSKFFAEEGVDLKELLRKFDKKKLVWVKEGMLQAFSANLNLPLNEIALIQMKKIGTGLSAIVGDPRRLGKLLIQMEHFFEEFLEERKRIEASVEDQYAPIRKQKEEEMSRQMGARVRIDPSQDPEYLKLLRQNMTLIEDRYNEVLSKVKQEIRKMCE